MWVKYVFVFCSLSKFLTIDKKELRKQFYGLDKVLDKNIRHISNEATVTITVDYALDKCTVKLLSSGVTYEALVDRVCFIFKQNSEALAEQLVMSGATVHYDFIDETDSEFRKEKKRELLSKLRGIAFSKTPYKRKKKF